MMKGIFSIVFLFAFLSIQGQKGIEEVKNRGLPILRSFTKSDHGAGDNCQAIIRDSRGITYVANDQGILEFDGLHWNLIPNTTKSQVYSLCIDDIPERSTKDRPLNRIYAGSSGDIGYLGVDSTGHLGYFSLLDLIPEKHRDFSLVFRVLAVKEGIVFQTNNYLFLYQEGRIKVHQPVATSSGFHFAHALNGNLYVTEVDHGSGLWKLSGDSLRQVEDGKDLLDMYVMAMISLPGGKGLVLTYQNGFFIYDDEGLRPWETPANDILKQRDCLRAERNSNGLLAVQTLNQGMFLIDDQGNIQDFFSENDVRASKVANDLMFDEIGNLWVVHDQGIHILELSSPFSQFDVYAGLPGGGVASDLFKGNLFVCTDKGVFSKPWEPARQQLDKEWAFKPVNGAEIKSLYLLPVGNSLFVSFLDGLGLVLNDEKSEYINKVDVGRIFRIIKLKQHPSYVLCTSSVGLLLMENKTPNGPIPNWIFKKRFGEIQGDYLGLVEEPAGTFWVNKPSGGFWRFGLNSELESLIDLRNYGPENGLPVSAVDKVFEMDGEVVFTTQDGMYRYQESTDRFFPDTTFNRSLKGRASIFHLRENKEGNIWVWSGASEGPSSESRRRLHMIEPKEDLNGKKAYIVNDQLFLKVRKRMMENIDITPLENGNAFFSSNDGLIYYDASSTFDKSTSFNALIRKVELIKPRDSTLFGGSLVNGFGVPDTILSFQHNSTIPFSNNALRFTYSANYPTDPSEFQFKIFLEGNDETWSEWTSDSKKEYSNLAEGSYTFHVKARNIFETESRATQFSFTISAPWYRTLAAYGAYTLLGLSLMLGIVKFNTRRLRKDKEKLEITIQQRTDQLRKTNAKLLEMDKFKKGMTSMIVHDLKNPLNAILNAPHSLSAENRIQMMKNSGKQMLDLVMNILDLDKYEESQMLIDMREQALPVLIDSAVEEVDFLRQQKNISIIQDMSSCTWVMADPGIFDRIMVNLLTNAIKYTPIGGSINLSCEKADDNMIKILVEDTGEGIPKDKLDEVFRKFGQVMAKKSGKVRSTGLGLTFCKMAVEAHGGKIGVDSELGQGSTFWFTLNRSDRTDQISNITARSQKKKDLIELSPENRKELWEMASNLQSIPVYKISQIREILKSISIQTENESSGYWLEELNAAINTGDQINYETLINQILNEKK